MNLFNYLAAMAVFLTPPGGGDLIDLATVSWQNKIDTLISEQESQGPPKSASELILRLRKRDAVGRKALVEATYRLFGSDRELARAAILARLHELDLDNTRKLKSVIPASGWFTETDYGEEVADAAWFIVQHSPDLALQSDVANRLYPMVLGGEVKGSRYALLIDRVMVRKGKDQIYGSQTECKHGHIELFPVADEAELDTRRAKLGLPPIADYRSLIGVGKDC